MWCWLVFSLAPVLRSTGSAAGCPALFVGFVATMTGSDFSGLLIDGYGSSPSRREPVGLAACGSPRDLPVPAYGAWVRARFSDHAGTGRALAFLSSAHAAFHELNRVGSPDLCFSRLNGWPAPPPVNASPRSSRSAAHDSEQHTSELQSLRHLVCRL